MRDVIHDIDIKLLRIFRVVARQKSFSLAADQLDTSPSNISMNMAQLESRLKMRLCERGVKGFRLTEEGKRVLAASEELYEAIRKYRDQISSVAEDMKTEFRIGVLSESMFESRMRIPELVADLELALPGSFFHMEFDVATNLKDRVHDGELHAAFGYFTDLPSSFESRYLYSERHLCYCGSRHVLFDLPYEDIDTQLLQQHRIAGYDDLADEEERVIPLFAKYDSCSRTDEGVLALILTGNYIGLLNESFAQFWVDRGEIRVIDKEELELRVDIELIYRSNKKHEMAVNTLLEIVDKFYPVTRGEAR